MPKCKCKVQATNILKDAVWRGGPQRQTPAPDPSLCFCVCSKNRNTCQGDWAADRRSFLVCSVRLVSVGTHCCVHLCSATWEIFSAHSGYWCRSVFDNALSPCFLPIGNEVHAQEKWVTVSLPFVLDVTSTVPPSPSLSFSLYNLRLSDAVGFVYCCSPSSSPSYIPSSVKASHSVFSQLIDTFALEIGELKKEMVQTSPTADKEPMDLQG